MSALPEGYRLTENPAEIDAVATHAYLVRSYWAEGIPLDTVQASIDGSFCIAIYFADDQVAFCRLVTDFVTFAYLMDVYVLEAHRGKGLASAMLGYLQNHPRLQGLRRWMLFTIDAQPLYRKAGWENYPYPDRLMVRDFPDIYQ